MNQQTMILILFIVIFILLCIIVYQKLIIEKTLKRKINQISRKLSSILAEDSAELIKVFTDQEVLQELISAVNQLLLDRLKQKADFKETESASKRMLSNISHDIKTPLTVILGYLEMLRINNPEDEILKKIEKKANQVMELISEFFTLAKLEAGDMKMEVKLVSLNELCRRTILDFYDILRQQDFEVVIAIPESTILVEGDEQAISRILNNLISNAIRYGAAGQYLGITLRKEADSMAVVDVTDKGKGIEKEAISHIFERLYTMEDSRSRKIQGNGLGLTIAKSLALTMGGDVLVCSDPQIQTTFTLTLPIVRERNS